MRYEKHPLELEELLLAPQMRWLALTNKKEMTNPSFGEIVKHLESFFVVQVILNGTTTDCGCGVAFAIYASTAFRMVKHRVKNGVKPERGAVIFEKVFLLIVSDCVDECCCCFD